MQCIQMSINKSCARYRSTCYSNGQKINIQFTISKWQETIEIIDTWYEYRIPNGMALCNWIEWNGGWCECWTQLHFLLSSFKRFRWGLNECSIKLGKSLMASSCARLGVHCSLAWILFRKDLESVKTKLSTIVNSKLQARAAITTTYSDVIFR